MFTYRPFIFFFRRWGHRNIDDWLGFVFYLIIIFFAYKTFTLFFDDPDIDHSLDLVLFLITIFFSYKLFILSFPWWAHWWLVTFCFVFHQLLFFLAAHLFFFRRCGHGDIDDWLDFLFFMIIIVSAYNAFTLFFDDGDIDDSLDSLLFFIISFCSCRAFIILFRSWRHWLFVRFCLIFNNYFFCLQSFYIFFHDGHTHDSFDFVLFSIIILFAYRAFTFFLMMGTWRHSWFVGFCLIFDNYCFCLQSIHFFFRSWEYRDIEDWLDFLFFLLTFFFSIQSIYFFFRDPHMETLMIA